MVLLWHQFFSQLPKGRTSMISWFWKTWVSPCSSLFSFLGTVGHWWFPFCYYLHRHLDQYVVTTHLSYGLTWGNSSPIVLIYYYWSDAARFGLPRVLSWRFWPFHLWEKIVGFSGSKLFLPSFLWVTCHSVDILPFLFRSWNSWSYTVAVTCYARETVCACVCGWISVEAGFFIALRVIGLLLLPIPLL